jgi:hypothetical protein
MDQGIIQQLHTVEMRSDKRVALRFESVYGNGRCYRYHSILRRVVAFEDTNGALPIFVDFLLGYLNGKKEDLISSFGTF